MVPSVTLMGPDLLAQSTWTRPGEDERSIFRGPGSLPLKNLNTGQLLDEQRDEWQDKVALISRWQGASLTYQSLRTSSREIARSLLLHGVRPKDRVLVLAGNTIEYVQLFFAVSAIGAIFAIINPTFTSDEILPAVDFLDPAAIFVADRIGYRKCKVILAEIAQKLHGASLVVQLPSADKTCQGILSWPEFLEKSNTVMEPDILEPYWAKPSVEDVMCIQFTSGTTGPRKAAMLSHSNLVNNASLVGHRLGFTPNDVVLCCSPAFHCFGLVCGILAAIVHGGTAVLPSDVFVAESSLQALSENRCTVVHAVPTMFQAMLDHRDLQKHAPRICLRTGVIAGSGLSRNLLSRLSDKFRFTGLAYGYGMTELSCIVFLTIPPEESLLGDHTSVGSVMPHTSARVVDENLVTVPVGSPGELLVSGYLVFQGYYQNPASTAAALVRDSQGLMWLRTGDLVTIDAAGRCKIIGRVKDMIKRGGENIFPSDIEKVLDLHPDIAACAVVGIPDEYWGEIVVAFIQRAEESRPEAYTGKKDIKLWLRTRLAQHKVPEHFFWLGESEGIPDILPVNATGKVVKADLRAAASRLVGGSEPIGL